MENQEFAGDVLEAVAELGGLMAGDDVELTVANTVSEDDHLLGPDVVDLVVLLHSLHEGDLEAVDDLLAGVLECGGAVPAAHALVEAGHHGRDAVTSPGRVVEDVHSHHHQVVELGIDLTAPHSGVSDCKFTCIFSNPCPV